MSEVCGLRVDNGNFDGGGYNCARPKGHANHLPLPAPEDDMAAHDAAVRESVAVAIEAERDRFSTRDNYWRDDMTHAAAIARDASETP